MAFTMAFYTVYYFSSNRQILENNTVPFNTSSWKIARPDSVKISTVSPVSSSKYDGEDDTYANDSQLLDEDVLPKTFNKCYS